MAHRSRPTQQPASGSTKICIRGMHCRSCELLVEDELTQLPGITKVQLDFKSGQAVVAHTGNIDQKLIQQAVERAGYSIGTDQTKPIWISRSTKTWGYTVLIGAVLILAYLVYERTGLSLPKLGQTAGQTSALSALLVGLTAGVSTCMALVGGLVAGLMAKYNQAYPSADWRQRLKPLTVFLIGRLIGYAFLGGLMGALGSILALSMTTTAILTALVAVVMLFLGIQLLGISPRISQMSLTLPAGIARSLRLSGRAQNPYATAPTLLLGALTFFVPCGFTQAMQLVALGSGSFVTGASIMFLFALGTAPGLLSIGSLVGLIKSKGNRLFFILVGLVLIAFALLNLKGSLQVLGIKLPGVNAATSQTMTDFQPEVVNGVQIIRMTQDVDGYTPDALMVKRGIPVKWIITSVNAYTCASSLSVPDINVSRFLKEGENIVEFIPPDTGDQINFSCSMGMYSGQILIVD